MLVSSRSTGALESYRSGDGMSASRQVRYVCSRVGGSVGVFDAVVYLGVIRRRAGYVLLCGVVWLGMGILWKGLNAGESGEAAIDGDDGAGYKARCG